MKRGFAFVGLVLLFLLSACSSFDPFQFTTFSLRDGTVGRAYADTIRTVGGRGQVSMRLVDGQLPPGVGLRVSDRDGILHGEPTRPGDFQFTVEARDAAGSGDDHRAEIITHGFAITVDSLQDPEFSGR